MVRAFRDALVETLRFFRDDPVGFIRVLAVRVADGRKAAGDEYNKRREQ